MLSTNITPGKSSRDSPLPISRCRISCCGSSSTSVTTSSEYDFVNPVTNARSSTGRDSAFSNSSSRSWVLRRITSLLAASAVSLCRRAVSSRISSRSCAAASLCSTNWERVDSLRVMSVSGLATSCSGPDLAAVIQIGPATGHQAGELRLVAARYDVHQTSDPLLQRRHGLASILIEILNLEVQRRTLSRHATRDIELRVESRAGEARELWHRLTALSKRGEEGDIESVRQAQHIGDQPIVLIERHHHLLRHR